MQPNAEVLSGGLENEVGIDLEKANVNCWAFAFHFCGSEISENVTNKLPGEAWTKRKMIAGKSGG